MNALLFEAGFIKPLALPRPRGLLSGRSSCPSAELILSRLSTDSSDRGLVHFSQPNVRNTTTLLLSDDGSTLYVGARNNILSLDVSDPEVITLKEEVG